MDILNLKPNVKVTHFGVLTNVMGMHQSFMDTPNDQIERKISLLKMAVKTMNKAMQYAAHCTLGELFHL